MWISFRRSRCVATELLCTAKGRRPWGQRNARHKKARSRRAGHFKRVLLAGDSVQNRARKTGANCIAERANLVDVDSRVTVIRIVFKHFP